MSSAGWGPLAEVPVTSDRPRRPPLAVELLGFTSVFVGGYFSFGSHVGVVAVWV